MSSHVLISLASNLIISPTIRRFIELLVACSVNNPYLKIVIFGKIVWQIIGINCNLYFKEYDWKNIDFKSLKSYV